MKANKILTAALLLGSLVMTTACSNEEDDIFDQSAAERLNAASETYSNLLTAGTGKWAMEYFPTNNTDRYTGSGYLMTMKFDKSSAVTVGMKNIFSNNVYREATSMWQVITDDGPVLSFNTWNDNLHQFSQPEDIPFTTGSGNNEQGTGVGGDYEFIITSYSEDGKEIYLKGKKHGIYDRLLQLPDTTTLQSYVEDLEGFSNKIFVDGAPNPQYLMLNGDSMQVDSCFTGIIRLFHVGADAVSTQTLHPFLFSKQNGQYYLRFRDAIKFGQGEDSTVQQLRYDASKDIFVDEKNPNTYLCGADPYKFFLTNWNGARRFTLTRSSVMSDSFKTLVDNAYEDLRKLTYTFLSIQLTRNNSDNYNQLRLSLRTNRNGTMILDYHFDMAGDGKNVFALSNLTSTNKAAETVLSKAPNLQVLLNAIVQSQAISAGTTNFNLSTFKFTSTADNNQWFVLSM